MANQPYSGGQWGTIGGGVGTTVVTNRSGNLYRIVIPGTYVGTVTFHDAASAGGTSATSGIVTFGLPGVAPLQSVEIGARFRTGLTYEATGTPVITYVWD